MTLFWVANVSGTNTLSEIWHTLSPPTKEKERPSLYISCRTSACALRYKPPRVTHDVAVLLLGLNFHTKDPDCVNDTVNISHFPNLSLSEVSEDSMVTIRWYMALDANTMTSYTNTVALMKQQRIPPIFIWEAEAKMLEQWLVLITVLLGPQERHPAVFDLKTLLGSAEEVNSLLRAQAEVQQDTPAALVRLVQTKLNNIFRQVFASHLLVRWPHFTPCFGI